MIIRSCLARRTAQSRSPSFNPLLTRHFHQTFHRNDDHGMPNHYETLDLPTNASPGEIKKYLPTLPTPLQIPHRMLIGVQKILQTLQIAPPRPPPQLPRRLATLRPDQRSLRHPRQPRKTRPLRPRLPSNAAAISDLQHTQRFLLKPLHTCRRAPSLGVESATNAIPRPTAEFLQAGWVRAV